MAKKWYGSVSNRIDEGKQFVDEIKVGDGVTEYLWSDRLAYEVIEVKDQKHIIVREYDHIKNGGAYSNNWKLVSNESNSSEELNKRGKYWYRVLKSVSPTGEVNKRFERISISIGVADYYYDYEF